MKRLFIFMAMLFLLSPIVTYSQLVKVPFENKIANSSLILEGEVVGQYPILGPNGGIRTINKIAVNKSFQGEVVKDTVLVSTLGGRMDGAVESWSHVLGLNIGDVGIFFLNPDRSFQESKNEIYKNYSSSQGFLKYSIDNGKVISADAPFAHYGDVQSELVEQFRKKNGSPIYYRTPSWEKSNKCLVYNFEIIEPAANSNNFTINALVSVKSLEGSFHLYKSAIIAEYNLSVLGSNIFQNGVLTTSKVGISNNTYYSISSSDLSSNAIEVIVSANTSSIIDLVEVTETYVPLINLSITVSQIGDPNLLLDQVKMRQKSQYLDTSTGSINDFECIDIEGEVPVGLVCPEPEIFSFFPDTITAGTFDTLTIIGECFGATRDSSLVEFTNSKQGPFPIDWVRPFEGDYEEWSDTLIKVLVPSAVKSSTTNSAGSGKIRVNVTGIGADTSDLFLIVPYSVTNQSTLFLDNPTLSSVPTYIGNYNNSGGQAMYYSQNFKDYVGAVDAFERGLKKWRCATLINFVVEDSLDIVDYSKAGKIEFFALPDGVLAATANYLPDLVNCVENDIIVGSKREEFRIRLSSKFVWHTDESTPMLGLDTVDLESRALHELGHAHLLRHTNAANDMMYWTDAVAPLDYRRELTDNDINGGLYVVKTSVDEIPVICGDPMQRINPAFCMSVSDVVELENDEFIEVSIYPNPIINFVFVDIELAHSTKASNLSYIVSDLIGKKIIQNRILNSNFSIDTDSWSNGLFILSIIENDQVIYSSKLIKQD